MSGMSSLREQNELRREQNGYLCRIAEQLESGLGPEEVPELTLRENKILLNL